MMNLQLFIDGTEIDLAGNEFFPITYQQADAKNPEKRKRDQTKTIKLPGTRANRQFFSSAYDLKISNVYNDLVGFDFDPTLRYPCEAKRNGKTIFRGAMHLQKVVLKKNQVKSFDIVMYSSVSDLFQSLGDIKVSELGWSSFDHTLSVANIVASWSASVGSGYWYPYVDWGYADDVRYILTNQLIPYVYIAQVVEKCFEKGGFTLESDFYQLSRIQKIAWGRGGGEQLTITDAEAAERQANYTGDGSDSFSVNGTITLSETRFYKNYYFPVADTSFMTLTLVDDDIPQFNTSTGEFVTAYAGYYNLAFDGTFPISYAFSDAGLIGQDINLTCTIRIFVNGALLSSTSDVIVDGSSGSGSFTFDIDQELDLSVGDIVSVDIKLSTTGTKVGELAPAETFDFTFDLNNTLNLDITAVNTALVDGDTVKLSRFLPDMKAADFLKDQITMWNLYISDPDENGNILVESQDDYFYDNDDNDLWTDKLDRDSDIEIAPASNIEGKVYRFRFAEDRDYYKQLYFEKWGQDYGDFDYNVPSTFKKGEKLYQLKTAQSCPVQLEGTDIIIPRVFAIDESTLVRKPYKGKPRIFFNNGTTATSDGWDLVNSDTLVASAQSVYPIAHHLDDLSSPTFDLNFGRPEEVFYTATAYTTNTMFYEYHAQFIRELTGRDSKIVNAWFKFTEEDAYENFMRRLANIDGILYRKNIVKDWIANQNRLVKVELIKILEGNSRGTYTDSIGTGTLPPLFPVGDPTLPVTGDMEATSERGFYPVDTSSGDVTITLDADILRTGWTAEFPLIDATNTLTITATGTAQPAPTISGSTSIQITNQWDAPQIRFDGKNFYLK